MRPFTCLPALLVSVLFLSACQTPPAPKPIAPAAPVAAPLPAALPEPALPKGVFISAPQRGDTSVAFTQSNTGEATFPLNRIGANLAFTSNLRMPKLDAVANGPSAYQLRMRFSNATTRPLAVSLVCTYAGEQRAARVIQAVAFPVSTFRDIVIDLEGDPSRKMSIRASAIPIP